MLICPEQLGGLPTPRQPAEIIHGSGEDVLFDSKKVISIDGYYFTFNYIKGAHEVMKIVNLFTITAVILKEGSPSCGINEIYDGSFKHVVRPGQGVTAAILRHNGIPVYSEKDLNQNLLERLVRE
jgi:uncharacterized protein YbbK (DUF523 family)